MRTAELIAERRTATLPPETTVRTGHGDGTSIGDESPHLEEWIAQGRRRIESGGWNDQSR